MQLHQSRIRALDGVRGLAVLLVLLHHAVHFANPPFPPSGAFDSIAWELHVGVDLFFVLSGYLITRLLLEGKGQPSYFKNFYARRALRIFPLYYLFVLVLTVFVPVALHGTAIAHELSSHQLVYWLYVSNFDVFFHGWPRWPRELLSHTWSLSIEEQFYLVWPAVVRVVHKRRLLVAIAITLTGSVALRLAINLLGYGSRARVCTPAHLDGLMLGALIALLQHLETSPKVLRKLAAGCSALGVSLRIAALWVPFESLDSMLIASWSALFAALVAFSVSAPQESRVNRILGRRELVFLGKYSYGIYLIHQPLFMLIGRHVHSGSLPERSAVVLLVGGLTTAVLAVVVFETFERRFSKLKTRFE